MTPLVSVIIPCFNAEAWVAEAIDSVLEQTYQSLEIIVIDDGSSDRSLSIIQSYGAAVRWRSISNQGANHARNLGFSLARGKYIQYLDADDYLLPKKIAQQVKYLEKSNHNQDFVYSDWRYQHHLEHQEPTLGAIRKCGDKTDFLWSLLANDRWSNLAPMLFTRSILAKVSWDTTLPAAQDRDYLISLLLAGGQGGYWPGCQAIYRLHGATSVSTSSKLRWFLAHCQVMTKAEKKLQEQGQFLPQYQQALARAYWEMGQEYLYSFCRPEPQNHKIVSQTVNYQIYAQALDKVNQLAPQLLTCDKSLLYRLFHRCFGYQRVARLSYLWHSTRASLAL
ncbi:MAG: glycosyltransferase [Cyanobacteria bacterium J06623_7]